MNTSQAIGSSIESVAFLPLPASHIAALSARRITTASTFDTLLNPVPGGLYTPELGPFADNVCATCGLKTPQCAGHAGHIELPVLVFHPTFMEQVLRLLRGSCGYCGRFRLARVVVQRYVSKLRLVGAGLLREAKEIDDVGVRDVRGAEVTAGSDEEENSDEDEDDAGARDMIARLNRFVNAAIRTATAEGRVSTLKTEATTKARQNIIADVMAALTKGKKCHNCQGINHSYRKDRFVKIFRKPLSEKERLAMIQSGHKAKDAMVELAKQRSVKRKRTLKDEGIADMDISDESAPSSESEGDDVNMDDSDAEVAGAETTTTTTSTKPSAKSQEEYLNPARIHAQLLLLFSHEQPLLSAIYSQSRSSTAISPSMFFISSLLVPPSRFRPEARTGADEIAESPDNTLYKSILNTADTLTTIQRELSGLLPRDARYRARTYVDLETTWVSLQDAVNSLIDRDRNPLQVSLAAGRVQPEGIKQKLEKKEGMFRKYMMGKRVNFAARTVISPDPNIETNEIGVPPVFAVKLTYPEPVTQWNVEELQEAVRNGAFVWPGAVSIEDESGRIITLERKSPDERTALANTLLAPSGIVSGMGQRGTRGKKVHRHLGNGDVVIMNRQPTLHKPSMMCHRARVLPGEKTLRMHYANCNTYNADFDGDEMNLHFPQNEMARAEALTIADTDHQYLSATAGAPLRGLIQDHISMSVHLTSRGTFFERGEVMQLLYAALRPESGHCGSSGRVEMLPPCIWKPRALWSGKQVVSIVLKNLVPEGYEGLSMTGAATTNAKLWGREGEGEEGVVVFKDGELVQGVLDKKSIGPSAGGWVNAVYEVYGHTVAGRLLSVLGRLLTKLEGMRGFSCGVQDLIFTREGEVKRREALEGAGRIGTEVARKYVGLDGDEKAGERELRRRLEDVLRDVDGTGKQQGLDQLTNSATALSLSSAVTTACLPSGLTKPFPANQMQLMTSSGAKGSKVNANQISCNLGQQVLEGRRVPIMVSGKSLPCFAPFETSVRAGGYIVDRFLTGLRPQEAFFHAMAGREGLIDTAVKTSRSGYLQRCLIKGMEGLKVEYDTSVRDADGSVVQFLYGEDGLDVAKSRYLSDFKFAGENYVSLFNGLEVKGEFDRIVSADASEACRKAEKAFRRSGGDLGASEPGLSLWPPAKFAGSISEKLLKGAREYVDSNPDRLIRDKKKGIEGSGSLSKRNFNAILDVRYLKSVVEAGEAVGVVAGQSVGEPSTQMTLNTFHLAGHSAKNVTLGIPRLREIVMTAARNIATPTMTLKVNEGVSVEDARKFAKGVSRLSLAEVVEKVTVTERQGKGRAYAEARVYEVKVDMFGKDEYMKEYAITSEDVVATLEHRFLPRLQALARKELKKRGEEKSLKGRPEVGKSVGGVEMAKAGGEEGGDDGEGDSEAEGDASGDKDKANKTQAGYEALEDEEEVDIAARARREPSEEDETYGGSPKAAAAGDDDSESEIGEEEEERLAMRSAAKDREQRILASRKTNDVVSFAFDDKTGASCTFSLEYDAATAKILMLHLVELAAHAALIQSVPGISLAMLDEAATFDAKETNPSKQPVLATSGVNIPAMWDYQHIIHPHTLYTNSISTLLLTYGVECARSAIVLELQSVFGGHGISVDLRHLTLIADFMTRGGGYEAFSRMGYRSNVSPFMKMSFETTVGVLREAVLGGEVDGLEGPSARIVVGRLGRVGTGGFDVFLPVKGEEGQGEGVKDEGVGEDEMSE